MPAKKIRVLILGDIFGKPGRDAVVQKLPALKKKYSPDLVIANAENLSHGNGVSASTLQEMIAAGVDVFTSGNHIYDKKEVFELFKDPAYRLIRPLNFPSGSEGPGYLEVRLGDRLVLVVNLIGTVFAKALYDNPFAAIDRLLQEHDATRYDAVIVDMHADASSEKVAMGYHLDGRVSLVYGTHTHVPTADARILPGGAGYLSDIGMTGVLDGVIGMDRELVLEQFLGIGSNRPDVAEGGPLQLNALYAEIDPVTRRTHKLERINEIISLSK